MTSSRDFVSKLDQMATYWEERARVDPLSASCPRIAVGDEAAFSRSGRHLFEQHLSPLVQRALKDQDPAQSRLLDLGCGAGRLLPALHTTGAWVHGVDIAPTMLKAAQRRVSGEPRILLHAGDGMTLQCVRRHRFQWVVAIDLLAHLPDMLLRNYLLRQIAGRLAPGGLVAVELAPAHDAATATDLLDHTGLVQDDLLSADATVGPLLIARLATSGNP